MLTEDQKKLQEFAERVGNLLQEYGYSTGVISAVGMNNSMIAKYKPKEVNLNTPHHENFYRYMKQTIDQERDAYKLEDWEGGTDNERNVGTWNAIIYKPLRTSEE